MSNNVISYIMIILDHQLFLQNDWENVSQILYIDQDFYFYGYTSKVMTHQNFWHIKQNFTIYECTFEIHKSYDTSNALKFLKKN